VKSLSSASEQMVPSSEQWTGRPSLTAAVAIASDQNIALQYVFAIS